MNKHCFRLIFSKTLGFLIPVAETTSAQRKPGQTSGPRAISTVTPKPSLKRLALCVLLAGLPSWAAADIVADASNPSGTHVISAPNGVPVIEIANPNDKGLSHNRFSEFDVQNPGLIFNNSLVNGQSQIGGALLRNPNLQRSATAILSEVTGNKPSSISGTLEVFGGKADLLIANPNGITVNGVTTLNTSNLSLSTGHVKSADGGLQFLVDDTSGKVVVGADGVNTEGLSYFDIVARSVELQGKLGSDSRQTDLQITAGQGTYDSATGTFTAKPSAQGSSVAIAGSAAGAMHGRYINLISSDSGAGVRQDGLILAAKDIAISADGDIQLTTTTAKGNVQIASSASFTNTGALEANTTQIKARDVLNQKSASLGGTNGLTIEADKSVTNKGGELIGSTVSVKADAIHNTDQGRIVGTDITLTAQTDFSHDGKASIVAGRNLSIDTGIFSATDGELLAGHNLTVAADSYQNSATLRSKNNASLTLKHDNDLVIDRSFKGPSADALLVLSARDVTITDELNTAGSVAINAQRDVRNQGSIIVGKTLGITAKGLIDNQAGKLIWAGENLRLEAGTQLLNGLNSQILAMGDMSLEAGEKLQNNTGRIEAQKSVWIDAPLVENLSQSTGGLKSAGMAKEVTFSEDKYGDWGETQYFHTKIDLPLFASDLTVKQAVIKAGGDLLFNPGKAKDAAAKVRNVGGLIAATGNVAVEGDLENLGISTTRSLMDILVGAQTSTQWTVSSVVVKNDKPVYGTLFDLLQRTFGDNYSNQWVDSLKGIKTPEVNELISAVLGADWKAFNQQLQYRWKAFLETNPTKTYYADQQAEISAGKTFGQEGGSLTNGDGANAGGQRLITIQVGSETVKSLDGELNAQFDAKRADADKALKAQLDNPLFQRNQSGGGFGRIKPLYETRAKYLDQSQFLGSDYFLQKIGYDPGKTVSVLGDAYFDNQLILQNVEQRLGNFFAQTQRISGTDLAKQLLDNGAALALKAGLTLGEPLTEKQIAGLEKDVVWYENREVDGHLVLAPRVYLSQKTLAARDKDAKSSALVGGDTVLIDANAVNNVNGTVRGNTDTFVYAKTDINNVSGGGAQAGFFAGQGGKNEKAGQLVIAAEGTVNNQGGVMSGYEQTVVGGEGIRSSATTGYDKNGFLYVRDNGVFGTALSADAPKEETKPSTEPAAIADTAKPADKDPQKVAAPDVRAIFDERLAAGPVDTTQGSSLNVISGGNIDLTAAITQADNVSLQTSGHLNLNDLHEARSAFDSVSKNGFLSSVRITEVASSANSVGNTVNAKNLAIKTGGDLNITGGEINAQNSAIEVGGNSTIKAGKDLAFHKKTTETTQLVLGGGAGAGGYEATGSWGTAPKVDTHLGAAFYGTDEGGAQATVGGLEATQTPSIRGDVYAGRAANSQTLASNGTGARSGANKGRGATSGANFKVGLETVTTIDSSESATYRNAQLNLGNGSVKVGGTLDIGGADINSGYQLSPEERAKMTAEQRKAATDSMPTLAISAGDIKTTKVENTEKTRHFRDELFFGVTSEVHSSAIDIATQVGQLAHKAVGTDIVKDPNAPAGSSKTLATEDRKMDVDPALTAMAAVGLVTQAISGEVLGQSTTIGIKHTEQKSDSNSRSENINQLGGNISLTSTKGDIELNGVNLQGGKVGIKSAGNLTQRAAKSSTVSHDETNSQSAGLTTSIGVSATGVGAGISVGADGSGDKTTTTSTSYTNGLISGTEVSIETKGDHNLIGSNIKGNQVAVKVGGNQTITSVQDTSDMKHERNNWSASVGVAVTTNGLIQGTGSASASYGQDHDRSKLVAEQAGISADKLDLNVAGNLNLTGAHVTSQKGQGTVQVGGKINAQTLDDIREKDGGYAGGGGGISKNGLASVTVEFGRVDQVHYNATNAATIDVGDPNKVTATKGISGPVNTNTENQLNVTQNKRVAGTDVKVDFSAIADVKLAVGAVKKVFSPKTGGGVPTASKPISRVPDGPSGQKTNLHPDAPRAVPNLYVEAPTAKPKYDQRVIVNTDANDPAVKLAVQNLVNKNPGTVVVEPDGKGSHNVLKGTLAGGTTKVEVVGHGDGKTLGGLDSKQITDVVKNLATDGTTIDKLALVGCGTNCAKEGPSLVNDVNNQLLKQGIKSDVKGYDTPITVNEAGRKQLAQPGDAGTLDGDEALLAVAAQGFEALKAKTDLAGLAPAPKDIQRFTNLDFPDGYVQNPFNEQAINAHFIGDGTFIAMQYPGVGRIKKTGVDAKGKPTTEMVHQEDLDQKYLVNFGGVLSEVHTIVDLTQKLDHTRHGLRDYRPTGDSLQYAADGTKVKFKLAAEKPHHTIEGATTGKLAVRQLDADGNETKSLVDYLNAPIQDHMSKDPAWLDVVATDINTAIAKDKRNAEKNGTDTKCVAVHCTAGVGRTGLVIGAAQLKDLHDKGKLDPNNTQAAVDDLILAMRRDRGKHMVQDVGQYADLLAYAKDLAAGRFDGAKPEAAAPRTYPPIPKPASIDSRSNVVAYEAEAPRKYPLPPIPVSSGHNSNSGAGNGKPGPAAKPVARTVPPPPKDLPGGVTAPARPTSPTPAVTPRSPVDALAKAPALPARKPAPAHVEATPPPPAITPRSPVEGVSKAPVLPPRQASPTQGEATPPPAVPTRSPVDLIGKVPPATPDKPKPTPPIAAAKPVKPVVEPRGGDNAPLAAAPAFPVRRWSPPQIVDVSATKSDVVLRKKGPALGAPPPVPQRPNAPKRLSVRQSVAAANGQAPAVIKPDKHQVIVQVGKDQVVRDAATSLSRKHPGNTTQYAVGQTANGQLGGLNKVLPTGVPQLPADQTLKVQVVGHGDSAGKTIGGADSKDVLRIIKQVESQFGKSVDKVTLAGCNTAACLAGEVARELPDAKVSGFYTTRGVTPEGRKIYVEKGDPRALMRDAPPPPLEHTSTRKGLDETPPLPPTPRRPIAAPDKNTRDLPPPLPAPTYKTEVLDVALPVPPRPPKPIAESVKDGRGLPPPVPQRPHAAADVDAPPPLPTRAERPGTSDKKDAHVKWSTVNEDGLVSIGLAHDKPQLPAAADQVFYVKPGEQGNGPVVSHQDGSGVIKPDGDYVFVIEATKPYRLKAAKVDTVDGHTSLSLGKDVFYAGELKFKDGKMVSWSNGSGHYQPPQSLNVTNIPAEFKSFLKPEMFYQGYIRYVGHGNSPVMNPQPAIPDIALPDVNNNRH